MRGRWVPESRRAALALVACGLVAILSQFAACGDWHPNTSEQEEDERISGSCGVERWAVKTGTDAQAGSVNLTPLSGSIDNLITITAPSPIPASTRVSPTELQTQTLTNVTLLEYKLENDSDYHLVLSSNGKTMIAELPGPACVGSGSPFASAIAASRAAFDAKFTVTGSFQQANVLITLTGIPFFDQLHGQTGVAPNGIELHPVLHLCFGQDCAGVTNPDFSLSASPATVNGAGASSSISVAPTGGFLGSVSLSASGLPSGASASFSPPTITGSGSASLGLTAGSAAPGTYSVTVTGTSGALTHSAAVSWTIPAASDFALSANPSSVGSTLGGSTQSSLSASTSSGFAGAIALSYSGLPAGASAQFSASSISVGGNSTITLNAGTAAQGSYTVTVTGTSGALSHAATVQWTLSAAPDFNFSASPSSVSSNVGATATTTVSVGGSGGFAGAVALQATGLPAGANASFSPASVPAGNSASLTLAGGSAAGGTYTVTITGTSGTLSHSANVTWSIVNLPTPDFTLSASPSTASGATVTTSVLVGAVNGFSGSVALSASGLPTGASAAFSPTSLTGSGSSTLTLGAGSAAPGSYSVNVHGSSGARGHDATVLWTIPGNVKPDFTLSVSPASVSGAGPTTVISLGSSNGFSSKVALSASGLPTGARAVFGVTALSGSGSTSLTLEAGTASAGSYTVVVHGASGALSHSVQVGWALSGSGDTSPPAALVTAPASGTVVSGTVTITAQASDNVGVTQLQVLVDGFLLSSSAASALSASWDTSTAVDGAHSLSAVAMDAAGNTGTSATVQVTVQNAAPPGPIQLIQNGGFESALAHWAPGGSVLPTVSGAQVHGGARALFLGNASLPAPAGDSYAFQQVAIPGGAQSATLSFWSYLQTSDRAPLDWQEALVLDASGAVVETIFHQTSNARAWSQRTVDLSAYHGQTLFIQFNVHSDGGDQPTAMFIDEVSLVAQ